MRTRAEFVIVGGGIAGASIAYHLAELGKRDVLVLEQAELVGGTTSHAPGLVGQLRSSPALVQMLRHSVALYQKLSADGAPGYFREGSLRVAGSPERRAQMESHAAAARTVGLESHWLSPREALDRCPLLNVDGIQGALWIPDDGSAAAGVLAHALIEGARAKGVEFFANRPILGIETAGGRVKAVRTGAGRIELETLIAVAGIWSPKVGKLAGVSLPLTPMEHQYAVSAPVAELSGLTIPNLRDPDRLIYFRQREQALIVGGYERNPKPFDVDDIPNRSDPTVTRFDPARFQPLLDRARKRVPALANLPLVRWVNGLESFTPDGEFLLGPAPELANFWAACGFCAHGVSGAGGVGRVIAEWLVNGDPGVDVSAMSLKRFAGKTWTKQAIQDAATRVVATYYDITSH